MGLHDTLKSAYLESKRVASDNRLLDVVWLLEQEVDSWKTWVDLPLRRRLWLLRHGFTSPCGQLYDFETHGPEAYVSELQLYRLYRAINGRHRYLVDDKLSQHWMLSDYPDHRPTAYGFVDRGAVHGVAGTELAGAPVPVSEWLPVTLLERSPLVLKQLRGHGGKEVLVCEYDDGFRLDGEAVSEAELCEAVEELSGYLVTEYVHQHEYADDLYPDAANTIRLLTLWDDEAGELVMPMAIHRVGTDRSSPVDNVSSGGLTAEIDLATGTLGPAAQFPFTGAVTWHETHPDTGARIDGATVPRWETISSTVERIAMDNTNIPALGWDVILDRSGDPILIEANTGTDLDLMQVHRPLLADPRVARLASRTLADVDAPASDRSPERPVEVPAP